MWNTNYTKSNYKFICWESSAMKHQKMHKTQAECQNTEIQLQLLLWLTHTILLKPRMNLATECAHILKLWNCCPEKSCLHHLMFLLFWDILFWWKMFIKAASFLTRLICGKLKFLCRCWSRHTKYQHLDLLRMECLDILTFWRWRSDVAWFFDLMGRTFYAI